MGLIERFFSLARRTEEGDVEASPSSAGDVSALRQISDGDDVVTEVAGYELDMNSSINVRWTDGRHEVECSHTGDGWNTKVCEGGESAVVSKHGSREKAVEAAESVMAGEDIPEGDRRETTEPEKSEFEEEVDAILEDVDTDSIEEVGEAFGD